MISKSTVLATLLLLATLTAQAATPQPYHLELEANPAAPFPYLSKLGTVTLHVYPAGIRAESFWLNSYSRNGSSSLRIENPIGRMYADVPLAQLAPTLAKLAGGIEREAVPVLTTPTAGTVGGIAATRYRLVAGPAAWIDIWTTTVMPPNPQLHALVNEMVKGISPGTAKAAAAISGTPIYVELNFRRFKKLPLLKLKKLTWNADGENDALSTGPIYFKAPQSDAIWK
jgi:hypothetical protein